MALGLRADHREFSYRRLFFLFYNAHTSRRRKITQNFVACINNQARGGLNWVHPSSFRLVAIVWLFLNFTEIVVFVNFLTNRSAHDFSFSFINLVDVFHKLLQFQGFGKMIINILNILLDDQLDIIIAGVYRLRLILFCGAETWSASDCEQIDFSATKPLGLRPSW